MDGSSLGPGTISWNGVLYRTLLSTEATNGAMAVVDSLSPAGSGPPLHIHADADETFVLLDGDVDFWMNGERFTRKAGESVFVPRGAEHTYFVPGPKPSRHLVILTPGGFEGFFAAMAEGRYAIPADMARIVEIGLKHHLTFTGPPLAAVSVDAAAA